MGLGRDALAAARHGRVNGTAGLSPGIVALLIAALAVALGCAVYAFRLRAERAAAANNAREAARQAARARAAEAELSEALARVIDHGDDD